MSEAPPERVLRLSLKKCIIPDGDVAPWGWLVEALPVGFALHAVDPGVYTEFEVTRTTERPEP
jgi:hypothetical protein